MNTANNVFAINDTVSVEAILADVKRPEFAAAFETAFAARTEAEAKANKMANRIRKGITFVGVAVAAVGIVAIAVMANKHRD